MQAPALTAPERDLYTRIVLAEARGQGPQGLAAVAHVIKNRMASGKYGGDNAFDVITAKHQFEPMASWGSGKGNDPSLIDPRSKEYAGAANIVDSVMGGAVPDPTGGMTHFYSPKGQAALGRAAPAWAKGPGLTIGDHVFYAPEGKADGSAMSYAPATGAAPASAPTGQDGSLKAILAAMAANSGGGQVAAPRQGLIAQLLFGSKGIGGIQDGLAKSMPDGLIGSLFAGGGSAGGGAPAMPPTAGGSGFRMPEPVIGENDSNGAYWTAERQRAAGSSGQQPPAPVGAPYPLVGSMQRPAPAESLYSQPPANPPIPPPRPAWANGDPGLPAPAAPGPLNLGPPGPNLGMPVAGAPAPLNLAPDRNLGLPDVGDTGTLDPRLQPNLGVPMPGDTAPLDRRLLPPRQPEMAVQPDARNEALFRPPGSGNSSLWDAVQNAPRQAATPAQRNMSMIERLFSGGSLWPGPAYAGQ